MKTYTITCDLCQTSLTQGNFTYYQISGVDKDVCFECHKATTTMHASEDWIKLRAEAVVEIAREKAAEAAELVTVEAVR